MNLSDVYHANMLDAAFKHLNSHFVPGDGNPNARICFVGEAPGATEDKRRLPFQGPSGRILDGLLERIGSNRDETFVTNVLKYRPPNNRAPTPFEINESLVYLGEELNAVKPEFVVLLGKIPTRAFYPGKRFHNLLGTIETYENKFKTLVTYHPAAVLYNPNLKPKMQRHFDLLADLLKGAAYDGTGH